MRCDDKISLHQGSGQKEQSGQKVMSLQREGKDSKGHELTLIPESGFSIGPNTRKCPYELNMKGVLVSVERIIHKSLELHVDLVKSLQRNKTALQ